MEKINVVEFRKQGDPHVSDYSLEQAYLEGRSAHAAMERNHGGGFDNPSLVRAWTAGWEDAEISDTD